MAKKPVSRMKVTVAKAVMSLSTYVFKDSRVPAKTRWVEKIVNNETGHELIAYVVECNGYLRRMVHDPITGTRSLWSRVMCRLDAGMKMHRGIHLHHDNGDTLDDRPENVFPVTASAHASCHKGGKKLSRAEALLWKRKNNAGTWKYEVIAE